jgi:Cu/Ag efflux pump CusA
MPMMMEKSFQARFLIPMAISLAFGVLFATMITLLLVPSLYMIVEDLKSIYRRIRINIDPTFAPVGETTR